MCMRAGDSVLRGLFVNASADILNDTGAETPNRFLVLALCIVIVIVAVIVIVVIVIVVALYVIVIVIVIVIVMDIVTLVSNRNRKLCRYRGRYR